MFLPRSHLEENTISLHREHLLLVVYIWDIGNSGVHYPLHWEYIPGLHMYMTICRICNSYLIGASGLHVYTSGSVYVGHGCSWTGLQPLVCTVGHKQRL